MSTIIRAIAEASDIYPATLPTPSSVKYHIIERDRNGWAEFGVCAKISGVWCINCDAYERWLHARFAA